MGTWGREGRDSGSGFGLLSFPPSLSSPRSRVWGSTESEGLERWGKGWHFQKGGDQN